VITTAPLSHPARSRTLTPHILWGPLPEGERESVPFSPREKVPEGRMRYYVRLAKLGVSR
jgi:hypothetical protein